MVRRLRISLVTMLAVLAALPVAGCGGDKATAPKANLVGHWVGAIAGGGTMSLSLTQDGQSVGGNGSLSGGGESISLVVEGTFYDPTFSLTLKSAGYEPTVLTGSLTGKVMDGHLDGSGFTGESVSLAKQ